MRKHQHSTKSSLVQPSKASRLASKPHGKRSLVLKGVRRHLTTTLTTHSTTSHLTAMLHPSVNQSPLSHSTLLPNSISGRGSATHLLNGTEGPLSFSPHQTTKRHFSSPAAPASAYPSWYEHPYGDWNRNRMLPLSTKSYQDLRNFSFTLPKKYNMGVDIADKHVYAGNGSNRALIYVNQETGKDYTVDYNFISTQSNKVANALRYMGIQKGDRVGLLMSQSVEVAVMHAAVYKVGAIAVPLSILFGEEALEYRIKASGAKVLFVEPSKLEDIIPVLEKTPDLQSLILSPHLSSLSEPESIITPEQYLRANDLKGMAGLLKKKFFTLPEILDNGSKHHDAERTSVEDPALIIFTSGTTGNPKAALHRQSVLLGHLPSVEAVYDLWPQKDDVIFTGSDVSWIGGLLNTLLTSMHHGVPVLLNRAKKFDADYMFKLLEKYHVKNAFLPPTALKMMREVPNPRQKYNYNMRSIGTGGESLGESILNWGQDTFGLSINEFYGQTECNLVLGNSGKIVPVKNGSMGIAMPGHQVEVLDDAGNVVPHRKVGQIAIKGPHPIMFSGYFNNEKATKEKYIGDNWLLTGDLGKRDQDGYFYYIGRNDDVISSAGYRIGPAEVEMSLMHHNAVSNACAVGTPDELRNEVVKAFIILTPQAQDQYFGGQDAFKAFIEAHPHGEYDMHPQAKELQHELMTFVKNKLAKHEFPRQIEFVSALPMTTTGKIIRKTLKKQEFERYYKAMGKPIPEGMF